MESVGKKITKFQYRYVYIMYSTDQFDLLLDLNLLYCTDDVVCITGEGQVEKKTCGSHSFYVYIWHILVFSFIVLVVVIVDDVLFIFTSTQHIGEMLINCHSSSLIV